MRPLPHIWNESAKPELALVPKAETKPNVKAESTSDKVETKSIKEELDKWLHHDVEEWFPEELHHVGEATNLDNTFTFGSRDGKFANIFYFFSPCISSVSAVNMTLFR